MTTNHQVSTQSTGGDDSPYGTTGHHDNHAESLSGTRGIRMSTIPAEIRALYSNTRLRNTGMLHSEIQPLPLSTLPHDPLVTILTSNYNYAAYIGDAIESVLAQTYPLFEMIICDDGSTDASVAHITPYTESDSRIRLVTQDNGGQASAWNLAYASSRGSIICILDSDDMFTSDKLETVVRGFQLRPDAGLFIHPKLIIDEKGTVLGQRPSVPDFDDGWIGPKVLRRNGRWTVMSGSTLCFRREAAEVIFPIPEGLSRAYADEFIMRIAPLLVPVSSCSKPLICYRSHSDNVTNDREKANDPEYLASVLSRKRHTEAAVNARLEETGYQDRVLPPHTHAKLVYWISLTDGSRVWRSARLLAPLLKDVLADDRETRVKKLVKAGLYTSALVLPRRMAAMLMEGVFSPHFLHKARRLWPLGASPTPGTPPRNSVQNAQVNESIDSNGSAETASNIANERRLRARKQ